jgi:hypothetical protein
LNSIETRSGNKAVLSVNISPNPFTDFTGISFNNIRNGRIEIYGINGELVYSSKIKNPGKINWNARNLSNGVYIVNVHDGLITSRRTMIHMK